MSRRLCCRMVKRLNLKDKRTIMTDNIEELIKDVNIMFNKGIIKIDCRS